MEDRYILEKWEWTDADYEIMGWHDCSIYAISFEDAIYLDIDYIFKWNDNGDGKPFTFWMSPATMIFENPFYLKIDTVLSFVNGIEIADILKEKNDDGATIWRIDTQQGEILIGAEKFRQVVRKPPSFQYNQFIPPDERGDISFSLTFEKSYQDSADVLIRKKAESEIRKLMNEKIDLTLEIDNLEKAGLETKNYLKTKRLLTQRIEEIKVVLGRISK